MSTIEIDSQPLALDALLNVSVSYSFDPLKQALGYIFKKLRENSETVALLKGHLGGKQFCFSRVTFIEWPLCLQPWTLHPKLLLISRYFFHISPSQNKLQEMEDRLKILESGPGVQGKRMSSTAVIQPPIVPSKHQSTTAVASNQDKATPPPPPSIPEESKLLPVVNEHEERLNELEQEIRKLRLKVSKMASSTPGPSHSNASSAIANEPIEQSNISPS